MTTLAQKNSTECLTPKVFTVDLSELKEYIQKEYSGWNDLRNIPMEVTADVAIALIAKAMRELTLYAGFNYTHIPNTPVTNQVVFLQGNHTVRTRAHLVEITPEYDTTCLNRYYSGDQLLTMVEETRYWLTTRIYSLTPNAGFMHPVDIMHPYETTMMVRIHPDDLVPIDDDPISNESDG